MKPLRLGFNPRIRPENRRRLHERLRHVVEVAVHLEFDVVELGMSTAMYDLGLSTVFDPQSIEILDDAPLRFHLNLFDDDTTSNRASVTDVTAYSRSVALRQIVQIVEFFEHRHAMEMYVVHPGRRVTHEAAHLDALRESMRTMHNLFPGLPIALHTGFAFHSVDANHLAFEARMDYLQRFVDQIAEIRWHNTAPGERPSVPLHRPLEDGIDLGMLMRTVGRNPGTLHMIETVGLDPPALVREVRTLHRALSA